MIRRRTLLLGAAGTLGLAVNAATAQDKYPSRPIRLIVPFPPGGPADVMGRLVAQQLSTTVGQVIVENRPGAGGTLAGKAVATAEPDGYTLLLGGSAVLAIGPALYPNAGYDPLTAFVSIAMFSDAPYVMIAATNAPFSNVRELLAYARQHPALSILASRTARRRTCWPKMFKARTGADIQIVPYRGANTLMTDMMAGRIHAGFETTSVTLGHLGDGKMRGLAVLRDTRLPQLPEVPTMVEAGVNDVYGSSWICVNAPAGTPPDIIARLRNAIVAGVNSPEIGNRLKAMAAEPKEFPPSELAAFIASEHQRIGAVLRHAGVKAQ